MSELDPAMLGALAVVTIIGIGFVVAGYDLKDLLLAWAGWISGALLGGGVGWFVLPEVIEELTSEQQIVGTIVLILIGMVLGRILLGVVVRLTIMLLVFVMTAASVIFLALGDAILEALTPPEEQDGVDQFETMIENVLNLPLFESPEFLVGALIAGLVAAVLALRYYGPIIAVILTSFGAGILGISYPLWQSVLDGSAVAVGEAEVSSTVFGIALVAGLVIQYVRHSGLMEE